jgi:hypothetical protein
MIALLRLGRNGLHRSIVVATAVTKVQNATAVRRFTDRFIPP